MNRNESCVWIGLVLCAALLGACSKPAAAPEADAGKADPAPKAETAERTVKLSSADVAALGLVMTPAAKTDYVPESEGYGVVVSHDAIAQVLADVATATAAAGQSAAAFARIQRLAGTAGADTPEAQELAQKQASSDRAALTLAMRKVATVLGQHSPWAGRVNDPTVEAIATGKRQLARVTFPLGTLRAAVPQSLRLARLDAATVEAQWHATQVWAAPADPIIPGHAFFALLPAGDAAEGERLAAWASTGDAAAAATGVWIPAAAAIISDGQYWCYVERAAGLFERRVIDIQHPLRDGYVIPQGINAGDRVVASGAGLLLARETNSSSGGD